MADHLAEDGLIIAATHAPLGLLNPDRLHLDRNQADDLKDDFAEDSDAQEETEA